MNNPNECLVMCFRCGYCGQPTDSIGNPISRDEINELSELVNWDKADQTHGACCPQDPEINMVQITREMAMDAQDMSLEGQWIEGETPSKRQVAKLIADGVSINRGDSDG